MTTALATGEQPEPPPASGGVPPSRAGLFVALALVAVALRPELVGLGPLQAGVRADLGISRAAFGILSTLPLVGMGVFALAAGPLASRLGTRTAVAIAIWVILVSSVLRSLAPSYAWVVAATALLGAGMGLGNALPSMVVKERLADAATIGTATYATGIQLGAALAATLVVPMATLFGGWRGSLAALALAPAIAAVAWPLLVGHLKPRKAQMPGADTVRAQGAGTGRGRGRAGTRTPPATRLRLAVLLACMSCAYYGTVAWLAADLVDNGWSSAAAGTALGVLGGTSILSTIAYGALGDRLGSHRGWIALGLASMLIALIGVVTTPALALLWAATFGFGNGVGFGATMTLPLDLVDDPSMVVALTGPMLFGGYVVGAASPPVVGLLRDASGGFQISFLVLAGLCVGGMLIVASRALRAPPALQPVSRTARGE